MSSSRPRSPYLAITSAANGGSSRARRALSPAILAVLALVAPTAPAGASTPVPGQTITTAVSWTTGGSPYVVQGWVTIGGGGALTIGSGVQVRFASGGGMTVQDGGTLSAAGAAGQPVAFTSDAAAPQSGDWYHILAEAGSHLRLTYCDVGYGGRYSNPALILRGADAEVRSCSLHDFPGTGINLENAGNTAWLADTTVTTTTGWAVYQNTMNMAPRYTNLVLAGGGVNGVVIDGDTVAGSVTLDGSSTRLNGAPILMRYGTIVPAGATLTIAPGTDLRTPPGGSFDVRDGGALLAEGTAQAPILIRANTASPATGDWYHIIAQAGSRLRLSHCDIGYGGRYSNPALIVRTSDAEVRNCTLHDFLGTGINLEGGGIAPIVADTAITTLTGWAIYQSTMNMAPRYERVTMIGGGVNAPVIDGDTVTGSVTLDGTAARFVGGAPIIMRYGTIVAAGATLTVVPGTEVRTPPGGAFEVRDGGALLAEGTASARILFRANTETPAPGDWYHIVAQAGSRLRLAYCDIGYGGKYSYPTLILRGSDAEVRNCVLHDFPNTGINLEGGGITPLIANTTITTTTGWAIYQNTMNMAPQYSYVTLAGTGVNALVVDGSTVEGSVTLAGNAAKFTGRKPVILLNPTVVPDGATLTIAAGTEVRTPPGGLFTAQVGGALIAEGTAAAPVTFRANTAAAIPGDWYHIVAQAGSRLRLKHCDIGYGGKYSNPALILRGSDAVIENSIVHHAAATGVQLEGAGVTPTITNTRVESNAGWAIYQNTLSMAPSYSGVTLAGNGHDALLVDGDQVAGAVALDAAGIGGAPIHFVRPATVLDGASLTLAAGTQLRVPSSWALAVAAGGTLVAAGTPASRVSILPDVDPPAGGYWYYLDAQPGSHLRLTDTDLRSGGRYASSSVRIQTGDAKVERCTVRDGGGDGIWVANEAYPRLAGNHILQNVFGVRNGSTRAFVDARMTWWGDASGPYHPTLNPQGKGNAVSDRVLFVPWLEDESGTVLSKVFLQLAGPAQVSPGETVEYAISYYAGAAVADAVLMVSLPSSGEFVQATGGGVFWAARHEAFWRLGDLTPGAEGTLALTVRYAWGLPNGIEDAALALLGGSDTAADVFDVAPYLDYVEQAIASVAPLDASSIAAERAAHAAVATLAGKAEAAGFHLGGGARVTLSSGRELTLVDYISDTGTTTISREGEVVLATTLAPGVARIETAGGGMEWQLVGGERRLYGDWLDDTPGGLGAHASSAATPFTWGDCFTNCALTDKDMTFDMVQRAQELGDRVLNTGECRKWLAKVKRGQTNLDGWLLCKPALEASLNIGGVISQTLMDCAVDCKVKDRFKHECRPGQSMARCDPNLTFNEWVFSKKGAVSKRNYWVWTCDPKTKLWSKATFTRCSSNEMCKDAWRGASGTPCVSGSCLEDDPEGPSSAPVADATAACARLAGDGLSCAAIPTAVRTARDPNAKHGAAGDVRPGQRLDYRVEFENEGAGTAYGVYIVDRLSDHLDDTTVAITGPGEYVPATREIFWTIGELAPKGETGSKGEVGLSVNVKGGLPGGTTVTNQAVVYFPSVPEETPTNTVVNVVQPVTATPQSVATTYATPVEVTLAGADVSGLPLTFAVGERPASGELAGAPPSLLYTPAEDFVGEDRFTFTASNGTAPSRPAGVPIAVAASPADARPPTVLWVSPAAGEAADSAALLAYDPAAGAWGPPVLVQLSEAVAPASLEGAVTLRDGAGVACAASVRFDAGTNRVVIMLRERWRPTAYTVTVAGAVADLAGNHLAAPYVWTFTARPPGSIRERLWALP
jgi:hypothetical protein